MLACDPRAHPPPRLASLRSLSGSRINDQLQVSGSYLSITKNQSDWLQAITYYNRSQVPAMPIPVGTRDQAPDLF